LEYAVKRTSSPNLNPLRFLGVVASEYLAAYELVGRQPPAGESGGPLDEDFLRTLDELEARMPPAATVADISRHPKFDASALKPSWDGATPEAQPLIGA
jgi:hypothetical protein